MSCLVLSCLASPNNRKNHTSKIFSNAKTEGIDFPTSFEDLPKFEDQNIPHAMIVFQYDETKDFPFVTLYQSEICLKQKKKTSFVCLILKKMKNHILFLFMIINDFFTVTQNTKEKSFLYLLYKLYFK